MNDRDMKDEYKLKHIAYIQDMRNELEQDDLISTINYFTSAGLFAYDKVHAHTGGVYIYILIQFNNVCAVWNLLLMLFSKIYFKEMIFQRLFIEVY